MPTMNSMIATAEGAQRKSPTCSSVGELGPCSLARYDVSDDRTEPQAEFTALRSEIDRIAMNTSGTDESS